ncbi:hypothetical protein Sinac_6025 [Singulisphaera acidiphila DSM 18658]|uniref:Uncharacterized protein n=1 Tax=Singulisphaera acidiphila (strain ATCC BAA-1392 / DSM 18658 / VKM B-2454 / MOB10) TaxID=886293 RepID=L0DN85_SINAD|nr:hypothetical protein Sinac_6025 [Singulisphaera acidiphila DSM 18658]
MRQAQFQLRSLTALITVAALAMAFHQSWARAQRNSMGLSHRIVSTVFTTRAAQRPPTTSKVGNPLPLAGMLAVSLAFSRLDRRSSEDRIVSRPSPSQEVKRLERERLQVLR